MPKLINQDVIEKKQTEQDRDIIIADLLMQLAEKEQRLADLELIVADMMMGGTV